MTGAVPIRAVSVRIGKVDADPTLPEGWTNIGCTTEEGFDVDWLPGATATGAPVSPLLPEGERSFTITLSADTVHAAVAAEADRRGCGYVVQGDRAWLMPRMAAGTRLWVSPDVDLDPPP